MASLSTNFRAFASNIEPPQERAKAAQDLPGQVRDYLQNHKELQTVYPHTRLAGSYGRQTANGQIKDVDTLLFVSDDYEGNIPALLSTIRDALDELPEELDDCGTVKTRAQRRSVNVELENHNLSLDIVPVRLTTNSTSDVLLVPDREWEKWVKTQPLGYAKFLTELNSEHGGKVVPLVKMLKHWRDMHFDRRRPKSYWLESLLVQHLKNGWVLTEGKNFDAILADLFESIHKRFEPTREQDNAVPSIPDGKLKNNVAWKWKRFEFDTFMLRVKEAQGWSRRAVNEVSNDEADKAVELWQKVFGQEFPDNCIAESICKGLDFGLASAQGRNLITGTGLVTTTPLSGVVTTVAPPKRFFGSHTTTRSEVGEG